MGDYDRYIIDPKRSLTRSNGGSHVSRTGLARGSSPSQARCRESGDRASFVYEPDDDPAAPGPRPSPGLPPQRSRGREPQVASASALGNGARHARTRKTGERTRNGDRAGQRVGSEFWSSRGG